jgi:hypothetical protein
MNLDYVPLLRVMRELHNIPRGQPPDFNGMKRFQQYVRTIFPRKRNGEIDEDAVYLLPLLAMNPMGKDHVTALLAEDISYTREVLAPFLDADDMRTCIECLFGDAAARTLGFTPRGLSPWAGLALALHEERAK